MKNQKGLQNARRLFAYQLGLTVFLVLLAWILINEKAAISAFLGGFVSFFPNLCFAILFFRQKEAHAAKQIVNSFYKGEALKIFLSIILFTLTFKFFNIVPLAFFAVFIMVQLMFWIVPLIFNR